MVCERRMRRRCCRSTACNCSVTPPNYLAEFESRKIIIQRQLLAECTSSECWRRFFTTKITDQAKGSARRPCPIAAILASSALTVGRDGRANGPLAAQTSSVCTQWRPTARGAAIRLPIACLARASSTRFGICARSCYPHSRASYRLDCPIAATNTPTTTNHG